MRLGELADRIRQMMRLALEDQDEKLDESFQDADACLSQLGIIADRRQRLVHRHVSYSSAALHATNALTSKTFTAAERDVFTLPDLEAMRADCVVIYMRFVYLRDSRVKQAYFLPDQHEYIYGPWRYKFVPPNPPKAKRQKAP